MEIGRGKVWTIGWMWQNIPPKVEQFLASDQTDMWPCVIVVEDHPLSIDQLRTFLLDRIAQSLQLLTVDFRIYSFILRE